MARQGTTPIITLDVPQKFDNCNVYVTIDQDGTQVTKASRTSEDIEITKHYDEDGNFDYSAVAMYLTQAETLGLEVGNARAQLRWVNFIDEAFASDIATIKIEESLLEEVIDYGN
jgi:hypothetical protein